MAGIRRVLVALGIRKPCTTTGLATGAYPQYMGATIDSGFRRVSWVFHTPHETSNTRLRDLWASDMLDVFG